MRAAAASLHLPREEASAAPALHYGTTISASAFVGFHLLKPRADASRRQYARSISVSDHALRPADKITISRDRQFNGCCARRCLFCEEPILSRDRISHSQADAPGLHTPRGAPAAPDISRRFRLSSAKLLTYSPTRSPADFSGRRRRKQAVERALYDILLVRQTCARHILQLGAEFLTAILMAT